ncbi:MAG TPA: hypothetical protein VL123_04995 [Candidatus Udaeobacter sp.]|jgi:hypothetical protein|nr:hypothetical protein [Candidatus Udaeobacter sp.]
MNRNVTSSFALLVGIALFVFVPATAKTIEVPNQQPDLQKAIDAASQSNDPENFVDLTQTPIFWNAMIDISDPNLNGSHHLTIRAKPGVLARAEIINQTPNGLLLHAGTVNGVKIQDLDFLRDITNLSDLVFLNQCTDLTMERCRLGYVNASLGGATLHMMVINYPTHVVIRNCGFFSVMPAEFDEALHVLTMGDPQNSLYLYNNDFSDFGKIGIRSDGAGPDSALFVLRNNVVLNSPAISPEPIAYSSGAKSNMRVRTSFNTAFASAANAEQLDVAAQTIAGTSTGGFLLLPPSTATEDGAFISRHWDATPGALNHDFYHLDASGGLHTPVSSYGLTILNGVPTVLDEVVDTDIDNQLRPSQGSLPHTDRGSDQLDSETAAASVPRVVPTSGLWAAARRNPDREIELAYGVGASGTLVAEVFDVGGRLLWRTTREVTAGASGILQGPRVGSSGVAFYRVRLAGASAATHEVRGRITLLK